MLSSWMNVRPNVSVAPPATCRCRMDGDRPHARISPTRSESTNAGEWGTTDRVIGAALCKGEGRRTGSTTIVDITGRSSLQLRRAGCHSGTSATCATSPGHSRESGGPTQDRDGQCLPDLVGRQRLGAHARRRLAAAAPLGGVVELGQLADLGGAGAVAGASARRARAASSPALAADPGLGELAWRPDRRPPRRSSVRARGVRRARSPSDRGRRAAPHHERRSRARRQRRDRPLPEDRTLGPTIARGSLPRHP